jgi:hypothetical protein
MATFEIIKIARLYVTAQSAPTAGAAESADSL